MQDIVPKGRSIRNVPVSDVRSRPKSKAESEPMREEPKIARRRPELVSDEPKIIRRRSEPVAEESEEVRETRREPVRHVEAKEEEEGTVDRETLRSVREEFETRRTRSKSKKRNWKLLGIVGGVIAVILLAIGISSAFNSAALEITPRTLEAKIADDLTARKSASEGLAYQIISIKQTGSETVRATGQEQVSRKATGTIVIYNNYNSTPQRLIKNTRFQTPEGLVFRITDSVTVPGKSGSNPGSVEAAVVADEPGESYNVGLKDFTIPGFKGDPRFAAFYARTKTPIAGGFVGTVKVIADADRKKAEANIESKVGQQLIAQLAAQVPPDKVTFDKAYSLDFKSLPEEGSGDQAILKKEGTLSIVVFDKKALSGVLAKNHVKGYANEPIEISNLASLAFVPKGDFKPATQDSISFNLAGNARFEWLFDELSLMQALLGQSRASVPGVLQKFPTIERADISLKPFWSRKLPDSMAKININKAASQGAK